MILPLCWVRLFIECTQHEPFKFVCDILLTLFI